MFPDKFGTTRKIIVQWFGKLKIKKICNGFSEIINQSKKKGKIPEKLIENPNETKEYVWCGGDTQGQGVCSPTLSLSMVSYCYAIELLYLYCYIYILLVVWAVIFILLASIYILLVVKAGIIRSANTKQFVETAFYSRKYVLFNHFISKIPF